MNLTKIIGFLLFILLIIPTSPLSANNDKNLVSNSDFKKLDINGEPAGWLKGGYGDNTRSYGFVTCNFYTPETFVHHPDCPANTKFRLTTHISGTDGDVKWYFTDIKIGKDKNFILSYQYQAYTYRGEAIARYTFPNGNYKYVVLGNMPQGVGAMGYSSWVNSKHQFIAPPKAISLTIFFASKPHLEGSICPFQEINGCYAPDLGTLSIANVTLVHDKQ